MVAVTTSVVTSGKPFSTPVKRAGRSEDKPATRRQGPPVPRT